MEGLVGDGISAYDTIFEKKPISKELAIEAVKDTQEVAAWLDLFSDPGGTSPRTGGKPVITVISEADSAYVVKVFEDMPERVSTFGFYNVSKEDGAVTKEHPR